MNRTHASCIFCKIVTGDHPAEIVYRDNTVTAFRDINPVAPTHILIVPNDHINSVNDAGTEDVQALGQLFLTAKSIAEGEDVAETGYRLIINTGPHARQSVYHIHMHLIGGQYMKHEMG